MDEKVMKVKTLIKSLESYKEADIYFFSIPNGEGFYKGCEIETDNKILLIYPKDRETNYEKIELLKCKEDNDEPRED